MNATETVKHIQEVDIRQGIIDFFTREGIIRNDRDIEEMKFTLRSDSKSILSSGQILFEVDFRRRFFSTTVDLAGDVFQSHSDEITDFTINDLTEVDVSYFEKSMGKIILKASIFSNFPRQ